MHNTSIIQSPPKDDISNFFSRTLIRLESRVESVQTKIVSLSKIVRLLQQYSERKDQQYEKQTSNMQSLHNKVSKIEQLEQLTLRFNQITLNVQNYSLRLEQINRNLEEKQKTINNTQERFNYQMHQVTKRIEKLEYGILQQIREGSKKQEKYNQHNPNNYIMEEITFKMTQMQHAHKADYEKLTKKIQKLLHPKSINTKQPKDDNYGLQRMDKQNSTRKKSTSHSKPHYKSK